MANKFFSLETYAGEQIQFGDRKLIPFSQALTIQWPFFDGGFIWNRPVSILETAPDGSEQVIKIYDVTRIAQILLWSLGTIGALLIWLLFRTTTQKRSN